MLITSYLSVVHIPRIIDWDDANLICLLGRTSPPAPDAFSHGAMTNKPPNPEGSRAAR